MSETRYRELFNNLRNGAIVLEAAPGDADFIIRDLNRAGEIIDGIRREDVIGARLIETFPGIKDSGLYDALWRVYENGRSEQLPDGRFRGGRGERWREYYVYRLPSGEMVALFSDVTEKRLRKEALLASEKRFRALCENSLTGISILQGNRVVYQNKEQERLFGPLPRAHIMIDPDKIHPDDVDEVKGFNRRIASVDNRTGDVHFRYFPGSDKNNPIWISCRTSFIEYQGVESILINIMDMTQTKELELLLFVQDKMASLGRVAAGIAHEIRSPLSGINIYLNTLEKFIARGEREEKIKEIFRHLLSASRKIDSVISRVMDFSKPGQPTFIMMDINQPVEEALKLSSVTLRKCGIQLEKSLAQDPPRCRLDPQRIEEVVLNLIHNAIDALKGVAREKRIMVKTSVEGADMVVRVLDSGPGVPLDDQRKVFDPFYTTKSDSTGIGLSICHRIITDHGGALNVQTSPWGGADFRVSVPLQNTRG
ncbi:MAG: PAS domain S-box protein [Desulfobacterales bacterium]|nr:PAS domain S-box protein [Desulfobacterales bacterium]